MSTLGVVLDTNVLLSGLAYPGSAPGKLIAAWRHGALNVVLSLFILEEVRRTLPKLTHRHGLTAPEIDDLVDALAILAEVINPDPVSDLDLRDAADQPVLGTLLAAVRSEAAQVLVTGDKDLLALRDRYAIVTPAEFWARHGGL